MLICLVGHAANTGEAFSEFRTGLDHLEFFVDRSEELQTWSEHLDGLGILHSGIKQIDYTPECDAQLSRPRQHSARILLASTIERLDHDLSGFVGGTYPAST